MQGSSSSGLRTDAAGPLREALRRKAGNCEGAAPNVLRRLQEAETPSHARWPEAWLWMSPQDMLSLRRKGGRASHPERVAATGSCSEMPRRAPTCSFSPCGPAQVSEVPSGHRLHLSSCSLRGSEGTEVAQSITNPRGHQGRGDASQCPSPPSVPSDAHVPGQECWATRASARGSGPERHQPLLTAQLRGRQGCRRWKAQHDLAEEARPPVRAEQDGPQRRGEAPLGTPPAHCWTPTAVRLCTGDPGGSTHTPGCVPNTGTYSPAVLQATVQIQCGQGGSLPVSRQGPSSPSLPEAAALPGAVVTVASPQGLPPLGLSSCVSPESPILPRTLTTLGRSHLLQGPRPVPSVRPVSR